MTSRTRWIVLLISTPVVVFVIVGGLLGRASAKEGSYPHLRIFEDVMSLILGSYVETVDVDKVMDGAMRGLAEGLDADSAYLTPEQAKLFEKPDTQATGTTGIELTRQYYLRVIAARDGSPAAKAGIQTGDSLRAINDAPTRNMSVVEGIRLLSGPVGTKVKLTLLRESLSDPHEVTLVREAPQSGNDVSGRAQAAGVGYVRIAAFGPNVASRIASQVTTLQRGGAASIVIDLRGTAQGALADGIAAARLFVPAGLLSTREGRGEGNVVQRADKGDGKIALPVILLSSNGTSGAAEVFAAALIDNKRATLVGEHTLGRAAEQKLVKLPDGSALWMTSARYLAPSGAVIHGTGLKPSIEVAQPDVDFGAAPPTDDPILDKALEQIGMKKAA